MMWRGGKINQVEEFSPTDLTIPGSESSVVVEGLTPAVTYTFSLHAHNAMGSSRPSEVILL